MSVNFCFDIETLGTESTSVVLSAAICAFEYSPKDLPQEPDLDAYYETLISSSLFVKFNIDEQIEAGRLVEKNTLLWWKNQPASAVKKSLKKSSDDVSMKDGITLLRDYIIRHRKNKSIMWIRGNLDQIAIDSLAKSAGEAPISSFWTYRDIRTAIDILSDTSTGNGYCDLKLPFNKDNVVKHDPVHDVCYDILMLTFMK